jgi:preprotein translocase subunit SecB
MSKATYSVSNVILVESRFTRATEVSSIGDLQKHFNIEIEPIRLEESVFNIALNVTFYAHIIGSDEHEVDFFVKMVGLFEKVGDLSEIPNEYFVHVNAPAIIFPFVREHIASTTAKSGIDAMLLPPFNFVDNYQRMLKEVDGGKEAE